MKTKQIENEMEALLDSIINYPYEDEFRKIDIQALISSLKEYRSERIKEETLTGASQDE